MSLEDFDMTAFGEDFEIVDTEETIEDPNEDQDDEKNNNDADPLKEKVENVGKKDKQDEESEGNEPEDKDGSSDDEGSSSQKIYSSLASALAEEGIITSLENIEKVKTPDDLFKIIKEEIKRNEFADLTEEQKEYLSAVRTGVDPKVYNDYTKVLKELETISEDELKNNDVLRKEIISQDYVNQGISKEKADKLAQRSIDLGEDLDESKEALKSLKEATKKEYQKMLSDQVKAKEETEKESVSQIKKLKDDLYKQSEIIPGIKINENVKQKVYDQMTKIVDKSGKTGEPLNALTKAREEDPIGFTIKMHYLFNLTNGFKDFDKLTQKVKSKAVQQLEQTLRKTTNIAGTNLDNNQELDIDEGLADFIDQL